MSTIVQNDSTILSEYAVDNLGTSFKVILVNSAEAVTNRGKEEIFIPDYQGLVKCIAVRRAAHSLKLSGGDIKFLRKTLGLRGKELAERLDVSAEHLSRCENGDKTLSLNSEKVLRTLVLLEAVYVLRKAIEDRVDENSKVSRKIDKILDSLRDIVSGLKILPVHDAGSIPTFYFRRVSRSEATTTAANDEDAQSDEWLDEAA